METGETIIREFEDLFGLITMTERKWLADRITAAVPVLPAGHVAPEGRQLIPKVAPDDREPVNAVKAGYSYLRANGVRYGDGPTVYNEHSQMISDLLDYIQRLRGVIREANTRLRHPDSGSTSAGPAPTADRRDAVMPKDGI